MKYQSIIVWGGAVCLLTMLAVFPGTAAGKVLQVPEDVATIEAAIEAAEDGDTIMVDETQLPATGIRQLGASRTSLIIGVEEPKDIGSGCELTYDFENYADNTAITTQIPGVTFSVLGQSCGGSPTLYMRVQSSFYSTTYASKVLLIDQGCPDFSSDYLSMVFDNPQSEVSFDVGPGSGTYYIRAYNAATGGTLVLSRTVTIPGGDLSTFRNVQLTRSVQDIRRIEIRESVGLFEAIDNLTFGADRTPPVVEIHQPVPQQCICGEITVAGIACDDDGEYDRDRLEYRRVFPNADDEWQLVREYVNSPVCTAGTLYTWDTTATGIVDGVYQLRVTAVNECGLTASDEITVYVDNHFSTLEFRGPTGVVGGSVCFDGTVWDQFCFDHYTVEYRSDSTWLPVDPDMEVYNSHVINDPFATWVGSTSLPDGKYQIRVFGQTQCNSTDTVTRTLILDNTPPTASITDPASCTDPGEVVTFTGTALDTNLDEWRLEYWNEATNSWVPISSGYSSVENGTLGTWSRPAGSGCPDIVRLRVWDEANVNPCATFGHDRHLREDYVVLKSGEADICWGDYDQDGDVDSEDLAAFANDYGGSCP